MGWTYTLLLGPLFRYTLDTPVCEYAIGYLSVMTVNLLIVKLTVDCAASKKNVYYTPNRERESRWRNVHSIFIGNFSCVLAKNSCD